MPFSDKDLEEYLRAHELSEDARQYIRNASRGLARDVGQSPYPSLLCQPPAPKMGTTVNCESRTVEGAYAARLEFDVKILAYYEQPPMVECVRHSKSGRARRTAYYPDFLILKPDEAIVVQTKDDAHLSKKCATTQTDWVCQPDGEYIDVPAREAFKSIGLRHIVVSSAQLPRIETTNLKTLIRVRERSTPVPIAVRKTCAAFVNRSGVASLQQISHELRSINLEPVYVLLLDGTLQTDITRTLLTQTESCLVSTEQQLLRQDVYDLWIARYCGTVIVSTSDAGASAPQQRVPCETHLLRALANMQRVRSGENSRSVRRWRQRLREASKNGVSEIEALVPAWYRCGNTNAKRFDQVLALCRKHIREHWAAHESPSSSALYRSYLEAADIEHPGVSAVSEPTFRKYLRMVAPTLARQRGGTRAANAAATPSAVEDRAIKAQRPFEVALCDHYDADLYCIVRTANGVNYVVRPILTALRDVCTGAILVGFLTLLPPSRRTCALMLRMCLRRHGRLPESLVVDRGAEFQSVYFSGLMAHCRIELIFRPSGHGRFGSEIERSFGQYKEFWLGGRPGNTARLRDDRAVSREYKAHARAELTFEEAAAEVPRYFGWFNDRCPDVATCSPQASLEDLLVRFPFSGVVVPDDEVFRIATAVDGGLYRVDPARGLHIGAYHYWSPELTSVTGRKQRVEIRRDPEDPYLVFALVRKRWVPCLAADETVHESVKDPVIKLARSTLEFESGDARRVAKRDAEIALARRIRECEEDEQAAKAAAQRIPAPSAEAPAASMFERVREESVEPLAMSRW